MSTGSAKERHLQAIKSEILGSAKSRLEQYDLIRHRIATRSALQGNDFTIYIAIHAADARLKADRAFDELDECEWKFIPARSDITG